MSVLDVIWHGLRDALLMGWAVWWALVFGFFISAVVQAWVPRERIENALSGSGPRPVAVATGLGAASSSCSYAAVAIGKSLFQKGASAASALAFQFASTNLVWELGLVLWVLIGWQFTLAEYLGGIVMIVLMAVLLRVFVSRSLEERARAHAQAADTGHQHHMAGEQMTWRRRLTSASAWSDVAHNFRGDWQMLWKEIATGFLLAGFVAQIGNGFLHSVFLSGSPALVQSVWGAFIGPLIAVLSFVCSVGNVPLAAVLWSGGISFAGVMAFIFADLIVLPIVAIYRKYYGREFALRITGLMFVTMVAAALVIDGIFSALGLIPAGARPTRTDIFSAITINYKLVLNIAGLAIFAVLFWLTARRGVTDPVCGMTVDRAKALSTEFDGRTIHFCSEHCRQTFEADPGSYADRTGGTSSTGSADRAGGTSGNAAGHRAHAHHHPANGRAAGATDPVCGMSVAPAHAPSTEHAGQAYYFCSGGCRERFLAAPDHYLPATRLRRAGSRHDRDA
ncbi:MAG TPA: permease [Solirubrobacteraceae bacterium]|nr:permease [Solirubrobacteraceae bacterium]